MLINELSKKTGISPHTIRFYEKSGLVKGRRDPEVKSNNYFHYDDEAVDRLEFILDAKSVGFTVNEIAQMIDAWYDNTYTTRQKLSLLDSKLEALDEKMREIREMKKRIIRFKDDIVNERCKS